MLDFNHLTSESIADVQIFNANSSAIYGRDNPLVSSPPDVSSWTTWIKPRGVNFVHIFALGGGGGGGAGGCGPFGAVNVGARGGAGGASGGQYSAIFPEYFIPNTLYVSVGYGGAGGIGANTFSSANGSYGRMSAVSIYPVIPKTGSANNYSNYYMCRVAGGAPGFGSIAGALANPGTANVGIIVTGSTLWPHLQNLAAALYQGQMQSGPLDFCTGAAAGTAGAAAAFPGNSEMLYGGSSGAAVASTAGALGVQGSTPLAIDAALFFPTLPSSGSADATASGITGSNGIIFSTRYYGGSGGGSSGTGAAANLRGGDGGKGGTACGGGGGGACYNAGLNSSGGSGGNGGDGIVIITSW